MSILVVGLNHRTAPVDVRQQLAFSREGAATALMLFRNHLPDCEAAILSTCNRVEMIVASEKEVTLESVLSFLAQARDLPVQHFRTYLYSMTGERAVRHFFRVVSGLDSMVVGEYQIVNQAKQAYALASEQGATGRVLNRLFHQAFSASKRIRTDTEIGLHKVSVPSVAVDVARCIFDNFRDKKTLVVGAGEMAQLVCQHLRSAEASDFVVTSRTLLNAKALAEACQGTAVPFTELDEQLVHADIVITATSCPKPILTRERLAAAHRLRRGRPLFIIDLAVPRNVEPEVAQLNQVYLYDVDALGKIVAQNQQQRAGQLEACEKILDEEVVSFEQWLAQARITPLIVQMYDDARSLRDLELERVFRRCPELSDAQRQAVSQMAERLISKFMHPCVATIRQHSMADPSVDLAHALHAVTKQELQRV